MQQQWRIRIKGGQRETVEVDLLIQAVIALGRQLAEEEHIEPLAENQMGDAP